MKQEPLIQSTALASKHLDNDKFNEFQANKQRIAEDLLAQGLSVLPTDDNKRPTIKWESLQWDALKDTKVFNSPKVKGIGIICGEISGNLEVVDIDTKNDLTGKLWASLSESLISSLPGIYDHIVIAQTKNKGYHLYYRCDKIEGSTKLAKNKDQTVLIETRGSHGYVCSPPTPGYEFISGDIRSIPRITPEERECIWAICRSYDECIEIEPNHGEPQETNGLSPFEDYNLRGDVVSLLTEYGWKFVKKGAERIHLRRPGKTDNSSSGNYHIEKRLFYCFSTSTVFECRAYNATQVFATLACNGDFSEASKKLRQLGYGSTSTFTSSKTSGNLGNDKIPDFPITGMSPTVQHFIKTCSETYGTPLDFWAGSALMATALAIGDKMELQGKYKNVPILWMNLIGDVSTGKTEAGLVCLSPFEQWDHEAKMLYDIRYAEYQQNASLPVSQRNTTMSVPEYRQYIVKDSTPEALSVVHSINRRGLLIARDEIKGWMDDFGRYNKSGEQSNFLSSFNRVAQVTNRKGGGEKNIIRIDKPCILVFGGMQPDLLPSLAADHRSENGFLARFCHVYPNSAKKPLYSDKEVPERLLSQWSNYLQKLTKISTQIPLWLSREAEQCYKEWFNANANTSNNEKSGYLKGVFGKLDIIALRVSIVIHAMHDPDSDEITQAEMAAALEITEYFRATAIKVYKILFHKESSVDKKAVIRYLDSLGNSQSQIAAVLKVSQQYVQKILKK